ncbi:unnamed protein product, partial [Mesorhabditis belari]|uniref:Copine-3 n=1 Tax=Mesorhabditis belari TaxID=2138241 RepID=A0AAF3J3V3_9BILA
MTTPTKRTQPSTSLQLTISAKGLKNRDLLSKSDPQCVLFQMEGRLAGRPEWKERGRTEKIMNCLDPEWNKRLDMEYLFEERQQLRFELFDLDSDSTSLSEHDFLGRFECDLAEIVSAVDGVLTGNLTGLRGKCGTITISADEMEDGSKEIVQFNCSGKNLDKKDLFGKSDPFLNIYRIRGDGSRQLAHRTEVIKKTLNPDWKTFDVNSKLLCGGDRNAKIVIECFDHDFDGGHDFIGNCETTLDRLLRKDDRELPLINAKKRAKKGDKYKNSGILQFNAVHVYKENSFLDFIQGGTQLDFAVAIDFTASNGPVHDPSSLHFINPSLPNQYEVALRACLDICQHYNHRKVFDAFGFGAKVGHNDRVSPVFNLNFRENPSVIGIQGVMDSYRNSLHQVHLYGPTNFSPVIEVVARHAAIYPRDGSKYQVLLIITDGAISDMAKTKAAIISASSLPLSIIIVGVGQDEFEAMDELDSDQKLLTHAGRVAVRDIVQFVPMRNFLGQYSYQNPHEHERSMGLLAKEVLAEIPAQLTGYMKMNKILPRPSDNPFPREPPAELPPQVAPIPQNPQYPPGNTPYPSGAQPYPQQSFDGSIHGYHQQQPQQYPQQQQPQQYPQQQAYGPPPAYSIQQQYPVQSSPYPPQPAYPNPTAPQQYGPVGGQGYPVYPPQQQQQPPYPQQAYNPNAPPAAEAAEAFQQMNINP